MRKALLTTYVKNTKKRKKKKRNKKGKYNKVTTGNIVAGKQANRSQIGIFFLLLLLL